MGAAAGMELRGMQASEGNASFSGECRFQQPVLESLSLPMVRLVLRSRVGRELIKCCHLINYCTPTGAWQGMDNTAAECQGWG